MVIVDASPDSAAALALMGALDDDLRRRYPDWDVHSLRAEEACDPRLIFLVAHVNGEAVGCGAVRTIDANVGEVKRMFVQPAWRGRGVARGLLAQLESRARQHGYVTLRIETGAGQPEAINLYRSAGYGDIAPFDEYVGNPVSRCFEKRLVP